MLDEGHEADYVQARQAMVRDQLARRGIRDPHVLRVMGEVPRELFVPESMRDAAYEDRALPVGEEQTISQPYIVAFMTERLDVRPGLRVLEVGTGTGYQAAILARLGADVFSVERIESLLAAARQRLETLGLECIRLCCADGSLGWPLHAPYDRIIVTAGAPEVPPALIDQVAEGGRLVVPVGGSDAQTLVCVEKHAGRTTETVLLACRFVKLVGRQGWEPLDGYD
jgi:protein-L-isoaspartate(D-aspartate) O-methyltransferase